METGSSRANHGENKEVPERDAEVEMYVMSVQLLKGKIK
jgi:hypothetical protein